MTYPVKHFESSDAGAPSLDRTVPGSLIQLLKGCLIDGYNLQPFTSLALASNGVDGRAEFPGNHGFRVHQIVTISGASGAAWNGEHRVTAVGTQWIEFEVEGTPSGESGAGLEIKASPVGNWEIAHINVAEDRAAFRSTDPASTGMYWYLDDRRSADIEGSPVTSTVVDFRFMRGVEAMADIDTRTDDFGDGFLFVGASSLAGATPYDIIADGRMVYLITHPVLDTGGEYRTVHAFGDFDSGVPGDPYGALLVLAQYGATGDTNGANNSYWAQMTSSSQKRMARSLDEVSKSVAVSLRGHAVSDYFGYGGYDYPNPANLELLVHAPILVHESATTLRGRMPGVAQPLHSAPLASRDVVAMEGRHYKAITHAHTPTPTPQAAQTLFDLSGPWR